jgi:enoyl-CoA hydratase/carnithine racemase
VRYIKAQHRGRARWFTLDRPEKLNILHPEDLSELRDVIADPASGVQAIVFAGAGQVAFSAGMNIEAFVCLTPPERMSCLTPESERRMAIRRTRYAFRASPSSIARIGTFTEEGRERWAIVAATTARFPE